LNSNPASHTCLTLGLYTMQSTQSWLSDLNQISSLENPGNPTAAAGSNVSKSTKYLFQSGILDITIRNSTYFGTATGGYVAEATMEVDVYEIIASKDFQQNGSNMDHLSQAFTDGTDNTDNIGGAGTQIKIESRGAGPWEMNLALSRWGIKILKKSKYFIPGGGTITYQMRDPKRHVVTSREMERELGCNKPGLTKFVYIIGKVIPGFTLAEPSAFVERLQVGVTRKYLYKVEGISEARDRLLTSTSTASNPS